MSQPRGKPPGEIFSTILALSDLIISSSTSQHNNMNMSRRLLFIVVVVVVVAVVQQQPAAAAFLLLPSVSSTHYANTSSPRCRRALSSATADNDGNNNNTNNNNQSTSAISNAKQQIHQVISTITDGGRRSKKLTSTQRLQIFSALTHLESLNPTLPPVRNNNNNNNNNNPAPPPPLVDGPWIVLYTDAPPPSNGQLGPFTGVAKQVINLKRGTYTNELYVGGRGVDEDEDAWLSAILEATWKEWDGIYLEEEEDSSSSSSSMATGRSSDSSSDSAIIDHGATTATTTWRVDFIKLTLSIFQIPIFTQYFKEGTARIWKMTYLDEDTRIVRAGKTGREGDDWIFYMRRGRRKNSDDDEK
jgi:hypothetical protein